MCWKIIDEDTNGICEFFWKPCMHNCMVGTGRSLQMLCCQMTSLAHAGWWRLSVLLVCADFCSTSRASSDDDQEPVQGPHGAPKKWDTDSVHSSALSLVSCSPKNLVTDSVQCKLDPCSQSISTSPPQIQSHHIVLMFLSLFWSCLNAWQGNSKQGPFQSAHPKSWSTGNLINLEKQWVFFPWIPQVLC